MPSELVDDDHEGTSKPYSCKNLAGWKVPNRAGVFPSSLDMFPDLESVGGDTCQFVPLGTWFDGWLRKGGREGGLLNTGSSSGDTGGNRYELDLQLHMYNVINSTESPPPTVVDQK